MIKLIYRLLRLQPNEAHIVLPLGFLLLSNSLTLNLSDIVAVSGFLDEVGASQILVVWGINMISIVLVTGLQSLIVDRSNRIKLMQRMCLIIMSIYLILSLLFFVEAPAWFTYSGLYLLAEQQGLFLPIIFWVMANDIFDTAQARRLFPLISSWGLIGQLLGLTIAAAVPFLPLHSSIDLLFFNAFLFLAIFLILPRALSKTKVRPVRYKLESTAETLTEGWGFVRDVPSFRYLMLSLLAIFLALTILDYHLLAEAERSSFLGEAVSFQTFYALYYLGMTLLAIAIQSLLTGRLIQKIALKNSFFILPGLLLASVSGIFAFPGLLSASTGLALSYLTKETIDETAQKSLQALVPAERRGRVSLFMDSYLYALGTILGCLATGLTLFLGASWQILPVYLYLPGALLVSLLAIGVIFKMRSVYELSLLSWRLKRRRRRASISSIMEIINFQQDSLP